MALLVRFTEGKDDDSSSWDPNQNAICVLSSKPIPICEVQMPICTNISCGVKQFLFCQSPTHISKHAVGSGYMPLLFTKKVSLYVVSCLKTTTCLLLEDCPCIPLFLQERVVHHLLTDISHQL